MPLNIYLVRRKGRVRTGLTIKMRRSRDFLKTRNSVKTRKHSEKESERLRANGFGKKQTK